MSKKFINFIICLVAFVVGVAGGLVGNIYLTLPNTEHLHVGEELYYSYNNENLEKIELTGSAGELSVHFLELGNKYTGDCTYIRYGTTDILIDCGSKSSSIGYVSDYLKTYMQDDVIEYCIVTHAHTDHYAGFTTTNGSMFELFDYGTIIDFGSATNKDASSGMLKKYITNREKAIDNGATYFDASTIREDNNKIYTFGTNNEVKLEILYNYYFENSIAGTENNYSVCALLSYDDKNFLFTGDLEEHKSQGETKLLQHNDSLQAIKNNGKDYGVDVYKAGHHGSATSSSKAFIDAIRPKVVCVCCCAGSEEYTTDIDKQFPTQNFIDVISNHTELIYVTTLCVDWENDKFASMNGNIVVIANLGQDIASNSVKCSNNDTVLKNSEWFNRTITYKGDTRPMRVWRPGYLT